MELKKILCAVDLKDSVNPAVEYAKMLSELSGASISAIYVVSSRSAYENLQVPVEDIAKGMRSIWSRARGDMDAFVEKQYNMGLQTVLDIYQAGYDAYWA